MANAQSRDTGSDYLYKHVTPAVLSSDMSFRETAPGPGDKLPSFDLPEAGGGRVKTSDFVGKKPILLITGSFTCPMTASSNPKLKRLFAEFGWEIEFIMLHVREAHPGEHYDQPHSIEEKLEHAQALKERDRLPWKIAVDDPDGTVHSSLDEKPNAAYLTDRDGRIVFRSLWAADDENLFNALGSVARGETPRQNESRRRMGPMAEGIGYMRDMVRLSGPRAKADIWRAAPPMAAMAWLADLYHPLPPKWRTYAAAMTIGAGLLAIGAILTRSASSRDRLA
jgi:hypothetical protein